MITLTPPLMVQKFQYQSCQQINDPVSGKRVYLTPGGTKTPSVTTILSATKDQTALDEWRKRVGIENAKKIAAEAANIGTAMHANLERFVLNEQRQPGGNFVHVQANKMADVIISSGLSKVKEVWAMEQSLYFPELYSGTTDLVGVYEDHPAIMDYKQTNKPKKEEWVEDYFLQLVAYAEAHNEVYGTEIRHGHIFMCSRDLQYQQFDLTPANYNKYRDLWYNRVENYYRNFHS